MNVVCPACHAEMTLDVLLSNDEARAAVGPLLERGIGLGGVAMRYVALFRPEKRRMSIERMCRLVAELLPDIERRAIERKGRDWAAPIEIWRAGMETVLAKRDKGTLTLPLTSHGLLYEVMCGLAEKAEAHAEREREESARQRRSTGPAAAPRDLHAMAQAIGQPALTTAAPPAYDGPSRAAQLIKAQNEANLRRRAGIEQAGDELPAMRVPLPTTPPASSAPATPEGGQP